MTALHAVQLAVAAVAAVLVFMRSRELLFRAPAGWAQLEATATPLAAGGTDSLSRLRELLRTLEPAWAARLAAAALAEPAGPRRDAAIAELRAELAREGQPALYVLVALGRAAVPLALVNVILEISWAMSGGTGLVALQKGLAARIALGHALTALAIGLGTATVCVVAASVLRRQVRHLDAELGRVETWLDGLVAEPETAPEGAER